MPRVAGLALGSHPRLPFVPWRGCLVRDPAPLDLGIRPPWISHLTRARLRSPQGDPLEFDLDDVASYGPEITGFRPWLGAVFASLEGRWVVRFTDDRILGFTRDELKRVRVTPQGVSLVVGPAEEVVDLREDEVRSYGPEPEGVRSWLGRLAHGTGEAWIRLKDGSEMRLPIGGGPHVTFVG